MSNEPVNYTNHLEDLLRDEAESFEALYLLHQYACDKYSILASIINIPVIFLTALIGFFSGFDLFPRQNIAIGAISIFASVIKTLDSYFAFSKRSETHRMVSISYIKLSKLVQIQLSLEKDIRIQAEDLINTITKERENIASFEPSISSDITRYFNQKFKRDLQHRRDARSIQENGNKDNTTNLPPILGKLTHIKINRQLNKSTLDLTNLTVETLPV